MLPRLPTQGDPRRQRMTGWGSRLRSDRPPPSPRGTPRHTPVRPFKVATGVRLPVPVGLVLNTKIGPLRLQLGRTRTYELVRSGTFRCSGSAALSGSPGTLFTGGWTPKPLARVGAWRAGDSQPRLPGMRGEPARGALPEPGFYSLPGLEQAQAFRRGLVPRPPLAHLTGLTVTQIGPGSATLTCPASPWLDTGDGLEIQPLAEAALATAVLTGAPRGAEVCTAVASFTQLRPATLDADKLIAHARTIVKTPTFTYAEAGVEDDLGREIARVIGAVIVRPREPPPPAYMPFGQPFEEPGYPTPDPYLRPLPVGVGTVSREEWEQLDPLSIMRMYGAGEPEVPITALLGMRLLELDRGQARFAISTSEWFCLRDREVAPGVLATLTHTGLTVASLALGKPGTRLGVVNMSVRFLRRVVPDGRELVGEAKVTDHEGDSVAASVTLMDADGQRVATAYQTAVLLRVRPQPRAPAERVLASVLFTDLVASTIRAGELGDEQWRHLLAEHGSVVRRQLIVFRGREIKTTGDGFLAIFDSPARAVRCAQAIRDCVKRLGLEIRAGIHMGEVELARGDVSGIAVHLAARVVEAAPSGEVLVSSTVRDLLLGSGLRFEDRGRRQLKGIEGEWSLFALTE